MPYQAKYLLLLLLVGGCTLFNRKTEEPKSNPIARVFDKYLYEDDLDAIILPNTSTEDSAHIVREFIDTWVRHHLMLQYAESNLPENKIDIEQQIQDYRESLMIYTYEKEYINQNLDTTILNSQLRDMFEKNIQDFQLSENIYRLRFVKLTSDAPSQDSIRPWLQSGRDEYKNALKRYCIKYGVQYNLDDSLWFNSSTFRINFPQAIHQMVANYQYQYFNFTDTPFVYHVKVSQVKIKETTAPLSYVEDQVARILLSERKLNLQKKLMENIYKDATRKKNFEIYTP